MKIGVLAYQGAVREHLNMLNKIEGVQGVEVKYLDALLSIDAIILPGGESTAISNLLHSYNLFEPLRKRILEGMPAWGTCAGMILLANEIEGQNAHLRVMDIKVKRNAYGGQLDSFSKEIYIDFLNKKFETVFIRAPIIESVGNKAEILLSIDNKIVCARQGKILATSFHPELTDDISFHKYFIDNIVKGN